MIFSNRALYTILEAQGTDTKLPTLSERGTDRDTMMIGSFYNFLDLMDGIPLSGPDEKDPSKMRPFALFDTVQQDLEQYLARHPARTSFTNSGYEISRKNEPLSIYDF